MDHGHRERLIRFCDSLRALDSSEEHSLENGGERVEGVWGEGRRGLFYTLLMVAPVGLLEVCMGRIPWRTM